MPKNWNLRDPQIHFIFFCKGRGQNSKSKRPSPHICFDFFGHANYLESTRSSDTLGKLVSCKRLESFRDPVILMHLEMMFLKCNRLLETKQGFEHMQCMSECMAQISLSGFTEGHSFISHWPGPVCDGGCPKRGNIVQNSDLWIYSGWWTLMDTSCSYKWIPVDTECYTYALRTCPNLKGWHHGLMGGS